MRYRSVLPRRTATALAACAVCTRYDADFDQWLTECAAGACAATPAVSRASSRGSAR